MSRSRPLLCIVATLALVSPAFGEAKTPFRFPEGKCGTKGELKYINGLPVLIVSGTSEEIGEAVGALALKKSTRTLDYPLDLLKYHKIDALWTAFVRAGQPMYRQFPDDYRTELEAMVKGAGVDHDKVVVGNTFFDLKKIFACSAVLVEPSRSATGGPLLGR